jgi:hypothetical protein
MSDSEEENGFRIQKGGEYYYLRMKGFFDSHGVDYTGKRIIFDITETNEEYKGRRVYKFTRREINKKDDT